MPKGRKANAVKVGDKIGCMVALSTARITTTDCRFQCEVCKVKKTTSAADIRSGMYLNRKSTGCVKCNARIRLETTGTTANHAGRSAVSVREGEQVGKMIALVDIPNQATRGRWRCSVCGVVRNISASEIRSMGDCACVECNKRERAPIIAAKRKATLERRYASVRSLRPHSNRANSFCLHKKTLICVDPGGVKIFRCRVCDMVGVPAVECQVMVRPAGRWGGNLTYRMWEETEASWDNAVRLIEDCG